MYVCVSACVRSCVRVRVCVRFSPIVGANASRFVLAQRLTQGGPLGARLVISIKVRLQKEESC